MSTLKVTIEELEILPHPNADALELAKVGEYRAVVGKGVYKTGDRALYIPEQAVLPQALIEELGLVGRLAGAEKNRVKAVRLRGELSQGIVCRPEGLGNLWEWYDNAEEEERQLAVRLRIDYADQLGITKWVPPIPVGMAGEIEAAPNLIRWIDIENIQRYPGMFEPGEPVVVTEKIHGTCFLLTYQVSSDEVWVTSKGQGGKNLAIKASDSNIYWRAARQFKLPELARELSQYLDQDRIGLFGEVYGDGVQDLHYGANASRNETLGFALFDIAVQKAGETRFLDAEVWDFATKLHPNKGIPPVPTVPVLYRGPYDFTMLAALSEGMEQVSGKELHLREGLVVRPATERRSEVTGGRAIGKIVSAGYLTRGGNATEYE